jgi:predicted DNA binding protein
MKEKILTEEESKILNLAVELGYFDVPRKVTVEILADKLSLDKQDVNGKLNLINQKILEEFVRKMNTPLKEETD